MVPFPLQTGSVQKCNECLTFIRYVWWSDEAHGYLYGDGNSQNSRIWNEFPPEAVDKPPLHLTKLTIGSRLTTMCILCTLHSAHKPSPVHFFSKAPRRPLVNKKKDRTMFLVDSSSRQLCCANSTAINLQCFSGLVQISARQRPWNGSAGAWNIWWFF